MKNNNNSKRNIVEEYIYSLREQIVDFTSKIAILNSAIKVNESMHKFTAQKEQRLLHACEARKEKLKLFANRLSSDRLSNKEKLSLIRERENKILGYELFKKQRLVLLIGTVIATFSILAISKNIGFAQYGDAFSWFVVFAVSIAISYYLCFIKHRREESQAREAIKQYFRHDSNDDELK